MLSNAIADAGYSKSSQSNSHSGNYHSVENFELVVSDGWLYLYKRIQGEYGRG